MSGPYYPSLRQVESYAKDANLVPVFREINADLETPVSAYMKVARGPYSYLLESVEGGERIARYSFIGTDPREIRQDRAGRGPGRGRSAEARGGDALQVQPRRRRLPGQVQRRGSGVHLVRRGPLLRAASDSQGGSPGTPRVGLHAVDHLLGIRPLASQHQGGQPRASDRRYAARVPGGRRSHRRRGPQARRPTYAPGAQSRPADGRRGRVQHEP